MKNTLILHAAQLVTPQGHTAHKGSDMEHLLIVEDGAVAVENGIISAVGSTDEVLRTVAQPDRFDVINASGQCLLPGFVDSHTHLIFGGYRPKEFFDRLAGKPYLEILKNGGGIQNTVRSTRIASYDELLVSTLCKLDGMLAQGVTCVESKSGYGLDFDNEFKQLYVSAACAKQHAIDLVSTYLGAHAIPADYAEHSDDYVSFMIHTMLPAIREKKLAEFCDVFCEDSVFSIEQSRRLLSAAQKMGFGLKLHADEMVPLGGAELATELGAVSADHLLAVSDRGIAQLAASETVATLLPCTAFCMRKPYARARKMIDTGCAIALATDFNPGSCFTYSIPLLLSLAVICMDMTLNEAITALTLNGAAAVGRAGSIGSLERGKKADILFLKFPDYRFLVYHAGINIVERVMKDGKIVVHEPFSVR